MAKTVGPVNIKVGVNAAGAFAEIGKLENRLKRSQGTISRLGKGVAGFAGRFGGTLASSLPGSSFLAGGAAAAGAAVASSLVSSFQSAFSRLFNVGKLATQFGTSTDAMVGLQYAAERTGVDADALTTGLNKMRQNLGQAALGGQAQIQTLSRLGLTYQQLQSLPVEQQFGLIADRLNEVSDVNERAALTMEIFGRGGQQMAVLLSRGTQGLERMSEEAKQLGLTFSKEDLARIKSLRATWVQVGAVLEGTATRILVDLAPAFEALGLVVAGLAQAIAAGAREISHFSDNVRNFLDDLGPGDSLGTSGRIADLTGFNRLGTTIGGANRTDFIMRPVVEAVIRVDNTLAQGFSSLQSSLDSELASLQGTPRLEQELARLETALNQQLISPNAGINSLVNPLLGLFGLSTGSSQAAQKQNFQLKLQFNLEAENLRWKQSQIDALKRRNALERDAAKLIEQTQSPLAVFTERLGQIQQLTGRGLISGNVAALASAGAFRQLAEALPQASATGPEALQQGSAAAQAAINRFNRQGGQVSIPEQIRNVLRQTQQIEQQQLNEAREVRRALQNLGVVAPAGLAP